LTNISKEELQRAKNLAKSNVLSALERQKDRLEEAVKNVKFWHEKKAFNTFIG